MHAERIVDKLNESILATQNSSKRAVYVAQKVEEQLNGYKNTNLLKITPLDTSTAFALVSSPCVSPSPSHAVIRALPAH